MPRKPKGADDLRVASRLPHAYGLSGMTCRLHQMTAIGLMRDDAGAGRPRKQPQRSERKEHSERRSAARPPTPSRPAPGRPMVHLLPQDVILRIASFLSPRQWARGPARACRAFHAVPWDALQFSASAATWEGPWRPARWVLAWLPESLSQASSSRLRHLTLSLPEQQVLRPSSACRGHLLDLSALTAWPNLESLELDGTPHRHQGGSMQWRAWTSRAWHSCRR